jgi:hypothetical protein
MEALGVMVEVIFYLVVDGVLESRPGMLHLPLRRVYGIGDAACTLFLYRFVDGKGILNPFCQAASTRSRPCSS